MAGSAEYWLENVAVELHRIGNLLEERRPEFLTEMLDYMNDTGLLQQRVIALRAERKRNPNARLGFPRKIK